MDLRLLDLVLASGEDVNVVFEYTTFGKKIRRKKLGMIAKSYGYVYVAQVAKEVCQT